MLHTKSFAFIHFQKTGGMSMTRYLINAADDPVTAFVPEKAFARTRKMAVSEDRAAKLTCLAGQRHEKPAQAILTMKEHGLEVPPRAFAMIRHPVELMLSYYKHIRKPRIWKLRGMTGETLSGHVKMAVENPFDVFCRNVRFYGNNDDQMVQFFDPAGFDRLDVVPLERVGEYLALRFGGQKNYAGIPLEHRNKSAEARTVDDIDPETRAFICGLYPKTAAIYETAMEARW